MFARDEAGERDDGDDHHDLQDDEGSGAPINVPRRQGGDDLAGHPVAIGRVRRDGAQIEKRIAERGMHEARLDIHPDQDREPDEIDAELRRRGGDERHEDEGDLEEFEEEGEHEDQRIDEEQKAGRASGRVTQQAFDPFVGRSPRRR